MEIKKENVLAAYETARKSGADSTMKVLEQLFGEETFKPKDITERVKTFDDALAELDRRANGKHPLVTEFESLQGYFCDNDSLSADVLAYLQLRIICTALNEGWEPQFTEDEWRYYPYFWLYTEQEIEDMDEEGKRSCCLRSTGDYQTEYAGFGYAYSDSAPSGAYAYVGSHLCLKSDTLAVYCGKQFIDLWADFYLIRKGK